ncbi:MAG TPA: UDP-N-acetylglucosamine 1-carboxyvinyltransferase [Patescibacteria group bacterium]|nr:UDP-N-acetylglucosamine 1-carboxyvinyltransferase [Patescibacteria group bacterium]
MERYLIRGGNVLRGETAVSGAKNIAAKALVAATLTSEEVTIKNIPLISDFLVVVEIIKELGGNVTLHDHTAVVSVPQYKRSIVSFEKAAETRTSTMLIAPLLARTGKAVVPNPGGCRIGVRPIERTIDGLKKLGAEITYDSEDGYFHATTKKLVGATYRFSKNTHTGTETLILAAVLADGKTILQNAAAEPEVDELIALLNEMGAQIKRTDPHTIEIQGVPQLHGATFTILPDKNEIVTFAVAALLTNGDILVKDAQKAHIQEFLHEVQRAGGGYEKGEQGIRFFAKDTLSPTHITTGIYPGFMTDWQSPWAVLMTKANGTSTIHETVYEYRFGYVSELLKMGAKIQLYNPEVTNPQEVYNFNLTDDKPQFFHAARIIGPTSLHNAAVTISDLRAGATLVLASLAANGESVVHGIHHLKRGYEKFAERLTTLGAEITYIQE